MTAANMGAIPNLSVAVDPAGNYLDLSKSVGSGSFATGQVSVTTSATSVVPARPGRQAVTITSTSAVAFYVGNASVTTSNGHFVVAAAGAGVTIPTAAAVFAVGASSLTVSYLETF